MYPNSDMSPVALTVMAVVVVVLAGVWLGLVFFAARQPRTEGARPGKEDVTRAAEPEPATPRGDVPGGPHARRPAGRSARPAGDDGTKEPLPHGAGQPR